MTPLDLPDRWHTLIAGHTLGTLTPAEQAELKHLLEKQPALAAELQAYEAALAQLPYALDPQPLPPELETKILQRLHAPPAIAPHPSRTQPPPVRPRRLRWGMGAAIAAGLLLMLGWDNHRLRRSLTVQAQQLNEAQTVIQQLEQEQQEGATVLASLQNPEAVYALKGAGKLTDTTGSVITLANENKAILVAHNLPSLPANQVYRFWSTNAANGSLMYCGQFTVQDDTPVQWPLPDPTCSLQSKQVLVTIDPATASTASGGELALLSTTADGS